MVPQGKFGARPRSRIYRERISIKKSNIPLLGNRIPGAWIYIVLLLIVLSDIGTLFFHPGIDHTLMTKLELVHTVMLVVVSFAVYSSLRDKDAVLRHMGKRLSEVKIQAESNRKSIKTLYNHMPCSVIGISPKREILFYNKIVEELTGIRSKDAFKKKCYEILGNGKICKECTANKVFHNKTACRTTLSRIYKGKTVYVDNTAIPILNEDETVNYILEIGLDISKQVELQKKNHSLFLEAVTSLSKLIGSRDHSTGTHSQRVRDIAVTLGKQIGLSQEELEMLSVAAILHDIGKIGIPENILNKTGKLSSWEFEVIQTHPLIGYEAIRNISPLKKVAQYVLYHHEAYDGSGYPHGLQREEIPLVSRILAVADVFEAITADRIYRQAMSRDQARNIMIEGRGTKFDPGIVDVFIELLDSGKFHLFYESDLSVKVG